MSFSIRSLQGHLGDQWAEWFDGLPNTGFSRKRFRCSKSCSKKMTRECKKGWIDLETHNDDYFERQDLADRIEVEG
jgi:hypothetical protein